MSDFVPHKGRPSPPGGRLAYRDDPVSIIFSPSDDPQLCFADGTRHRTSCLGCHDAPCMELAEADSSPFGSSLLDFPRDPSREVCPVDAMTWNRVAYGPIIDADKCIGCGLCAVSCPYGAIALSSDGTAVVQEQDPAITMSVAAVDQWHSRLPRHGSLGDPGMPFARRLPAIMARLGDIPRSRMTRNMLVACGVSARTRRKGDTNVRMDGVLHFVSGTIGVFELEAGSAALESPRALLEDIAVLHGRFHVPMDDIVPVSIVAELPNVRAEYYQVIDDISSVLNIQCRTLTLGLLCLLMWRYRTLPDLKASDLFTTQARPVDLHRSLVTVDPDFPAEEPYAGAFRPAK